MGDVQGDAGRRQSSGFDQLDESAEVARLGIDGK